MLNIEKYLSLPETVDSVELRPLFYELLCIPVTTTDDANEIACALWELADRQWHNYERIAADLADMITNWVIFNWNPHSMKFVINVTSVVAMLGLPRALCVIEESLNRPLAPELRDKLTTIVEHIKPNIEDPYSGMR